MQHRTTLSFVLLVILLIVSFTQLNGQTYGGDSQQSTIYLSDDQRRSILQQLMAMKNDYRSSDASAIPADTVDQEAEYANIMAQKKSMQDQILSTQSQTFGISAAAVTQVIDPNDVRITEAIDPNDAQVTQAIDPSQLNFEVVNQHESQFSRSIQESDQTAQYAQIMNQGYQQQPQQLQQQQTDEYSDETPRFVQIMQTNMQSKPSDEPVGANTFNPSSQDAAITPVIIPNAQQQQFGQSTAFFDQQQVSIQDMDQTSVYAAMEQDKNAERARLEQSVDQNVDALTANAFANNYQQSVQQGYEGYDQTNQYEDIMRQKGATQSQLEQRVDQVIIDAPGLSAAIDPLQTQNVAAQGRSWEVLNATPYYIPQQQQASTWQSYSTNTAADTRSFGALNSQQGGDQTSDYMAIMAQQRAYQQSLQQY